MMGVNHSIGLKTQSLHLFNYFNLLLKLSLAAMIMSVIANVAMLLLGQFLGNAGLLISVLFIFYLKTSFCLVYPLMAEKKVPPLLALKLSFKLVNKNINQFILIYLIFGLLFILGALTSGIGLLFVIPFYINLMGIVYRQVCGVTISVTESPEEPSNHVDSHKDNHTDDHADHDVGSNHTNNDSSSSQTGSGRFDA
jgi:uncharacterized membrane protein